MRHVEREGCMKRLAARDVIVLYILSKNKTRNESVLAIQNENKRREAEEI